MPFCIYCGTQNSDGYKFCIHCGKPCAAAPAIPAPPPFNFVQWFGKNKAWLLPIVVLLIAGIAVYQLFLKKHPDKEGKSLAAKECGCAETKAAEELRLKNEFLSKFDSYAFAGTEAAQQRLNEIKLAVDQIADSCLQAGQEAARRVAEKFKNPDDQRRFQQAYYEARQQCSTSGNGVADMDAKVEAKVQEFRQRLQLKSETATENEIQRLRDSLTNAAKTPPTEAPPAETAPSPTAGNLPAADVIRQFYAAENAVQSPSDVEPVLAYYAFPLTRYYDAYNVDRNRMAKIYSDSYFTTLAHHRVYGFENSIQTEAMPNGDTKVIVGCRFEFSTQKSPDDVRTRASTNVYLLSPAGKIKSVYPLQ